MTLFGPSISERVDISKLEEKNIKKLESKEFQDFDRARSFYYLASSVLKYDVDPTKYQGKKLQDEIKKALGNARGLLIKGRNKLKGAKKHGKKLDRLCNKLRQDIEFLGSHNRGTSPSLTIKLQDELKELHDYVSVIDAEIGKAIEMSDYAAKYIVNESKMVSKRESIENINSLYKSLNNSFSLGVMENSGRFGRIVLLIRKMITQVRALFTLEFEINHYLNQIKK